MNFIVIVADDMRWDLLEDMQFTKTMGQKFPNGFVANPVCCASRVSTLTGRHSHTTQIWGNNPPVGGFNLWRSLNGEDVSIAKRLNDAGYVTGLMGKYVNEYNPVDTSYIPPGWDEWLAVTTGGGAYYDVKFSNMGDEYVSPPGEYLTDFLRDQAISFVSRHKDEEFFLWVSPTSPHKSHVPAQRHEDSFPGVEWRPKSFDEGATQDKPEFYKNIPHLDTETISAIDEVYPKMRRCVQSLDELVQGIVRAVDSNGIAEETVIFFWSDNGFLLGEHRLYGKSVPYLEATRMPLVIRWPGIPPTFEPNALAQNIDIIPTIAGFAGVGGRYDGIDLSSYLMNGQAPSRDFVYIEHHANNKQPAFVQAQKKNRVYTLHSTGEEEWYNIQLDPLQMDNKLATAPESINQADLDAAKAFVQKNLSRGTPPGF